MENGGDLTSALVGILLAHGFGLAMSGDYSDLRKVSLPCRPGAVSHALASFSNVKYRVGQRGNAGRCRSSRSPGRLAMTLAGRLV
jgi:hypothetical protein